MDGLSLGPFVLSLPRLYAAAGLATLLIGVELLARHYGQRLSNWGWNAALTVLVAARIGFVLRHIDVYTQDPLSILYFWQGGFSPFWGIVAGALYSVASFWDDLKLMRQALKVSSLALTLWLGLSGFTLLSQPHEALTLPVMQLETLENNPVSLTSYRGAPLVMSFWASWCSSCRREMPLLRAVAQERPDTTFLFINQGETADTARAYSDVQGLPTERVLLDSRSQLGNSFSVLGLPTTLFFDAEGTLVERHMGGISRAALLEKLDRISQ